VEVREDQLLKALADMEAFAKGEGSAGKTLPKTQKQSNGGFSTVGDSEELAAKGGEDDEFEDESPVAQQTLAEWASEDAEKAFGGDEESEDEESSESEDEESSDEDAEEDTRKSQSVADLVKSHGVGGPFMDASPFIETLVDQVSDSDLQLRKSVLDMQRKQDQFNSKLSKAIVALGKSVMTLNAQLQEFGGQPVGMRKSVLAKSELSERFEQGFDFSKSQVLDAMVELCKSGRLQPIEVSKYETTNAMDAKVAHAVSEFLQQRA